MDLGAALIIPGYEHVTVVKEKTWTRVCRGVSTSTGEPVALKTTPTPRWFGSVSLDELAPLLWNQQAVGCLRTHEHRVLTRLAGRGTPRALGLLDHDGRRFAISSWLPGVRLLDLASDPTLRAQDLLEIAIQIATILDHAHHLGIVHRDLTPANILIDRGDDCLTASVLDWELASCNGIRPWGPVGTSAYKAPEQIALSIHPEHDVDARADLYAMGATLYHLVMGRPLFPDPATATAQHLLGPRPNAAILRDHAPGPLVDTIMGLLVRDPDRRISTAGAALRILRGDPLEIAAPPTQHIAPTATCLADAATALDGGDLCTAVRLLEAAGEGTDPTRLVTWARVWLAVDQLGQAEILLRHAIEEQAQPLARVLLAEVLRRQGRREEALAIARTADTDDFLPSIQELARCEMVTDRFLAAELSCLRCASVSPAAGLALLREQTDWLLRRCWDDPSSDILEPLATRAASLGVTLAEVEHADSSALYQVTVEASQRLDARSHPPGLRTAVATALALFQLGRDAEGVAAAALAAEDGFPVARTQIPLLPAELGRAPTAHLMALLDLGQGPLARRRSREWAGQQPEDPQAWLDVVRVAMVLDDHETAAKAVSELVGRGWSSPALCALDGLRSLRGGDPAGALAQVERGLERAVDHAGCWRIVALAQLAAGADDAALAAARTAYRWFPHRTNLQLLYRAEVRAAAFDDALTHFVALGESDRSSLDELRHLLDRVTGLPHELSIELHGLLAEVAPTTPVLPAVADALIALEPTAPAWRRLRHDILLATEQLDAALERAREWETEQPSVAAHLLCFDAAVRTGDGALAVSAARAAAALVPDDAALGWTLHHAHQVAGTLEGLATPEPQGLAFEVAALLSEVEVAPERAWQRARRGPLAEVDTAPVRGLYLEIAAAAEAWTDLSTIARGTAAPDLADIAATHSVRALRNLRELDLAQTETKRIEDPIARVIEEMKIVVVGSQPEAVARGRAAIGRHGPHPELLFLTGVALASAGDHDEALQQICAALIQRYPRAPKGWWLATWCHEAAGRLALAEQTVQGLLGTQGAVVPPLATYANLMLTIGRPGDARDAAARCYPVTRTERDLVDRLHARSRLPYLTTRTPWRRLLVTYLEPRPTRALT